MWSNSDKSMHNEKGTAWIKTHRTIRTWLVRKSHLTQLSARVHNTQIAFFRLRRRRIHQASDIAKLWLEFLSVLELIARIACAVSDCKNKCGEKQSPEMFSFLFRGFPRRFTPLNDTRGRLLPPQCRLSNGWQPYYEGRWHSYSRFIISQQPKCLCEMKNKEDAIFEQRAY